MVPTKCLLFLSALLFGVILNMVSSQGYSQQGQGQGQGGGGRQGGYGQQQQGGFGGGNAAGFRGGPQGRAYGSQYGGQQGGEDASKYNFRIYTEPEYYGYESKFPGGKAMFKSYRSAGRPGADGGYSSGGYSGGGYSSGGDRSAKSFDNSGSRGFQQPQY